MALPLCGAKNRSGSPCKNPGIGANGRCKFHGGATKGGGPPKGSANPLKHGFYSAALLPEEKKLYTRAEVGGIDDEIRLAKVKLFRFVKMAQSDEVQHLVDGALEVINKQGIDPKTGPFDKTELRAAAPNYADLIVKQLDIVRKLELARMQMQVMQKTLEADDPDITQPDGFQVVPYDDE